MAKTFTLRDAGNSAFVPGFRLVDAELPNGITLRTAIGGPRYSRKRPLVMLHGHPHTHVIWRKVAPFFAKDRLVILPDLRGYGDSSKPESTPDHRPYSKREMASDIAELARGLSLPPFDLVGHEGDGSGTVSRSTTLRCFQAPPLSILRRPRQCMKEPIRNLRPDTSGGSF